MKQALLVALLLVTGCERQQSAPSGYSHTVKLQRVCLDGVEYWQTDTAMPAITPRISPTTRQPVRCE